LGLEGKPTVVLKRVARAGEDQTVETTPAPQVSAVFTDGAGGEDWSSPRLYFAPEQTRPPTDLAYPKSISETTTWARRSDASSRASTARAR
jgi:hypothetical protein